MFLHLNVYGAIFNGKCRSASFGIKGQLKWKIDLCLNNRLVTAKQIGVDSSSLSHLVELLQTIEHLQEMPSLNVTPRMRVQVLLNNVL